MVNFVKTIKFLFREDRELYFSLYKILGFYPHNITYYRQALTHKSYQDNTVPYNNERLEFLGDAIIEAVISDILFRSFSQQPEGFLTNTRSKLVQRNMLNDISLRIGLNDLIKISEGNSFTYNSYVGGNAFEALIGAIYLDRGYSYCVWFLKKRILRRHVDLQEIATLEVNYKSKLLEWGQKKHISIVFHVDAIKDQGSNAPVFESTVYLDDKLTGRGRGFSKKESQQKAAHSAWNKIKTNAAPQIRPKAHAVKENLAQ